MWTMLWPLLLIIISNCFYNICAKSIPEDSDAFGALVVTYIAGAVIASVLFFAQSGGLEHLPQHKLAFCGAWACHRGA